MRIAIVGLGGVGSNLAYMLAKDKEHELTLVDFDTIEEKNVSRQFFSHSQVGSKKCEALAENLAQFGVSESIVPIDIKMAEELDYELLKDMNLVIMATDRLDSKIKAYKILSGKRIPMLMVNCDENIVEIKTAPEDSDRNAWTFDSGYNSTQTFLSNMAAAVVIYNMIQTGNYSRSLKFNPKEMWINLRR